MTLTFLRLGAFAATLAFSAGSLAAQYLNGQAASSVLGQPNFTSSFPSAAATNTLSSPRGIAIDKVTGTVFVSDAGHNRILRYASLSALQTGGSASAVLGQPDFTSITVNTTQGGLRNPAGLFLDSNGTLWVADCDNNRVLWFDNALALGNGANATGVLGQTNFTNAGTSNAASGMNKPSALVVDAADTLWVADTGNNRVLRFLNAASLTSGASSASRVLGQAAFNASISSNGGAAGMNGPCGVEATGNLLFVADSGNNRVVVFDISTVNNGMAAIRFLGTPDSSTATDGTSATRMHSPEGLHIDSRGTLYVADRVNNRVLALFSAASKATGAAADRVIGSSSFTDGFGGTTDAKFNNPVAVALNANDQLFVADRQNHRVLHFPPISVPTLKASASTVKLKPKRKKTVTYTLRNANYPGAYRITFPGSNSRFTVTASPKSGSTTSVLPIGGAKTVKITFRAKKKKTKRPISFAVTARAIAVPNRTAVVRTKVSVK